MSKEKSKRNRQEIPEGFTVAMAAVDFLPVLFFSIMISIISLRFYSVLFFIGAFFVIAGGFLKCLWKFIIALAKKNIPFLFYQMRVVMPLGFLMMMLSLAINYQKLNAVEIWNQISSFPACICYIIGMLGIFCMIYFARTLDSENAKHNWIEQGINATAQFFIMLGVLL